MLGIINPKLIWVEWVVVVYEPVYVPSKQKFSDRNQPSSQRLVLCHKRLSEMSDLSVTSSLSQEDYQSSRLCLGWGVRENCLPVVRYVYIGYTSCWLTQMCFVLNQTSHSRTRCATTSDIARSQYERIAFNLDHPQERRKNDRFYPNDPAFFRRGAAASDDNNNTSSLMHWITELLQQQIPGQIFPPLASMAMEI